MKQVIESFDTGELTVSEVPPPQLRPRGILVRTAASLVSAGTERMVISFAEKNLLQKARERPDLVRQVVDKARREGIVTTMDSVRNRLKQPLALGYSSAGTVVEVGAEAPVFAVGDRVACAGSGASHAEMGFIPRNLAVKLPDSVSFEAGAFATLGAIAMQGIRQGEVVLGSKVAVIGLGLLGQLAVQMLKAAGCQVFGIDLSPQRVQLALQMGADGACTSDAAEAQARSFTGGRGFDTVLITAATSSNKAIVQAGQIARDRAVVVAVGKVGMNIPHKLFYEKELSFRLSRSYGPGRYDPDYEEKGHDYPYSYVRWTEQRNMEAFLQLVADGAVQIEPLITHRFPIDDALKAYELITGEKDEPFLGVVLTYDTERPLARRIELKPAAFASQPAIRVGMVGAGNFTNAALLPAMRGVDGVDLVSIVSGSGLSARSTGDRFGFASCASDLDELLRDERVNWLVITTRHNLHAAQAMAGLDAGKDVFVEKPLALNRAELASVMAAQQRSGRRLMVGFNRRFAPMVKEMRSFLAERRRPLVGIYRCNAGAIPPEHWTQDPAVGGGRIIGEACHFVDLLQYLVGAPPLEVYARAARTEQGIVEDEAILTLTFADGSVGTVIYAAGGDKSFSKERIEIIGDGRVAVLDDFRSLELIQQGKRRSQTKRMRTDKGHRGEWEALAEAVRSAAPTPISLEDLVAAHLAVFAAVESLRQGCAVTLDTATFWAEVAALSAAG